MKFLKLFALVLIFAASGRAWSADAVDITYGYHPYWTGGWNGVIIKHLKLHEKYMRGVQKFLVNFVKFFHVLNTFLVNSLKL